MFFRVYDRSPYLQTALGPKTPILTSVRPYQEWAEKGIARIDPALEASAQGSPPVLSKSQKLEKTCFAKAPSTFPGPQE